MRCSSASAGPPLRRQFRVGKDLQRMETGHHRAGVGRGLQGRQLGGAAAMHHGLTRSPAQRGGGGRDGIVGHRQPDQLGAVDRLLRTQHRGVVQLPGQVLRRGGLPAGERDDRHAEPLERRGQHHRDATDADEGGARPGRRSAAERGRERVRHGGAIAS